MISLSRQSNWEETGSSCSSQVSMCLVISGLDPDWDEAKQRI